jgi:hypothetical protein
MDSETRSAWLHHLVPLAARPLEPISVVGREQPVQVYRFMGLK